MATEEIRAKIDGGLSQKRFLYRSVDALAREINEEPGIVLQFLRLHTDDYVISVFKDEIYASIKDRVDRALLKKQEALDTAMKDKGVEDKNRDRAKLKPVKKEKALEIPWALLDADLGRSYLYISRVFRRLYPGDSKIRAGELVRLMEGLEDILEKEQKEAEEAAREAATASRDITIRTNGTASTSSGITGVGTTDFGRGGVQEMGTGQGRATGGNWGY